MEKRYFKPEFESMTRTEMESYRWFALKKQIEYTYANSDLCKRKFAEAKITPDDIRSMSDYVNKVPFTTKQDLLLDQQQNPPYGTRLVVPKNKIHITYLTSGTSGKGQEVHTDTAADWVRFVDTVANVYTWSGWEKGEKAMLPLPIGITVAAPLHYEALRNLGCDLFNLGPYDTKTKLEHMKRFEISAVFSVPAYLGTLTAEAEELGYDLKKDFKVKKFLMATASYPISFIERIEEKWGAKVFDYYGSTQHAMAGTCEKGALFKGKRGHYHVFEWFALHEVINPDTLQPAKPGEIGEMVMTPLEKQSSPYLRFKTADRVRYFPCTECDCGRPYSLIEAGTTARYDDMMKVKGINIWPDTLDDIVFSKEPVAEYQGRLFISAEQKETAEMRVEFKAGTPPEVRTRVMTDISNDIRETTGIGFGVKEAKEKLPQHVFKARRWTDDRVKGLETKK